MSKPRESLESGLQLHRTGRLEQAEKVYRRLLRVDPGHADALHLLGLINHQRGEKELAVASIGKAIAINGSNGVYHANLGAVYLSQNKLADAANSFRSAIEMEPENASAHDRLGLVHAAQGDFARAVECHERAARLTPAEVEPWMHLGTALLGLKRPDEAAQVLQLAVDRAAGLPADHALRPQLAAIIVGLGNHILSLGALELARTWFERALDVDREHVIAIFQLGTICRNQGNLTDAIRRYEQGLQLDPRNAAALNNLGTIRESLNDQRKATACFERAVQLQPGFAEAHYNLGNCRRAAGDAEAAQAEYRTAIKLQPQLASAHNNLGSVLQAERRLPEAIECYRRAVMIRPEYAAAQYNLGNALQTLGELDQAEECYEIALRVRPVYPDVWNNRGTLASMQNRWADALACFRTALQHQPDHADAMINMGTVLKSQGHVDEARQLLERGLILKPSAKLRAQLATILPPIYASQADLVAERQRYTQELTKLVEAGENLDTDRDLLPNNFYLAYQGFNDLELQRLMARLYTVDPRSGCPKTQAKSPAKKIRIGFCSAHLHDHTIGRLTHGLIAALNRDEFEVVVLSVVGRADDKFSQQIQAVADTFVRVPQTIREARRVVLEQQLDVLIYPDLGMEPVTLTLAFTRCAPVQCTTWGHPVTTGIPTIDYYLSSELLEPEGAEAHYSEQLVRFKGLPAVYSRPALTGPVLTRADFELPASGAIYLCPQSLFKIHPEFDAILRDILTRDPTGHLVLIVGTYPHWTVQLQARFERTLAGVQDRVLFIPHQSRERFLQLMSLSDVLLDPLHFGGGNTTYEGLAVGVPIVTLPAAFMRGRVTSACYRRMGLCDCIARDAGHYAQLAVRLGTDAAWQQQVRQRIGATSQVLFEDRSVLQEMETFFRDVVRKPESVKIHNSSESTTPAAATPPSLTPLSFTTPSPTLPTLTPLSAVPTPVAATSTTIAALSDILQTETCPACGHHVAVPFFAGGQQPLTTLAWPRSAQEAQAMPLLPHNFLRCVDCGHVYNCEFNYANVPYSDKPNLMFNRGLVWKEHLRNVRDLILTALGPAPVVVEVGCGDGHLLRSLAEARPEGRYIGFDPSGAIDDGGGKIIGRRELFLPDRHLAELRPDLIVSRHVLEHLMNPLGFVQALGFAASWENLETRLLIEVPCIDQVFASGRTVDFFYEHNSHFTTTSLRRLLMRCASDVEQVERGYNHEVVYGLARFRRNVEQVQFAQESLRFRDRAQKSREGLRSDLSWLASTGKSVAIWGGTGKAAAFINQYGLDAARFPIVVDSDPDKAGTFVPGAGQEIRFRDWLLTNPVQVIVIATQWRAHDIALEIVRCGIDCQQVLLEHQGRLVDYDTDEHPYRTHAPKVSTSNLPLSATDEAA